MNSLSINTDFKRDFKFAIGWADFMFELLTPEGMHARPIPLRHECIFYYGHLPAFAFNQILRFGLKRPSRNAEFDSLFERGIDPPDLSKDKAAPAKWPEVAAIARYKDAVEKNIFEVLNSHDLNDLENSKLRHIVNLVLEHYLMHVETFFYMLHQLPEALRRPFDRAGTSPSSQKPRHEIQPVSGGIVTLGADGTTFGWCNEFQETKVALEAFGIDKYPVTNADFMRFVEADGYAQEKYWQPSAFQWIKRDRREHPHFWKKMGTHWYFRDLTGLVPLPEDNPVWVTWAEADAYAKWKEASLPTESQYHRAAFGTDESERRFPWGDEAPDSTRGNFGLHALSPHSVSAHPQGASFFGVEDLVGNGWEWTSSPFAPLEGFQPLPSYPGYSADFFDGSHFVMKGASPLTAERLIRRSFRNWFQPHYPYCYGKFRCVYKER